jgi:hypothetical protein
MIILNIFLDQRIQIYLLEDPALLSSYDLAPLPSPHPSIVSRLFLFLSLAVCRRSSLLTGEGGRE